MNSGRTICLENIDTMKQQNNWCSWVVKVYAGANGSNWKSCGVGILTFTLDGASLNTFSELEALIKSPDRPKWDKDGVDFRINVKAQKGLQPSKELEVASSEVQSLMRGGGGKDLILDCGLNQAENFDWDMNMVIFWTQKDKNLHVSLSFLQSEIFVESW